MLVKRSRPARITTAYKQFEERGPQYVDAETGLRAAAYRFGTRVLLVYEESETGVGHPFALTHRSAWKVNSTKFAARNGRLADALHPAKLVPYLCDHVTQG